MTGMKLIGPEPRVKALKSAANRLRWEVDYALGAGMCLDGPHGPGQVRAIVADFAETLAILRQVMTTMDEHRDLIETEFDGMLLGPLDEQLRGLLEFYRTYHETPR
jgi:hypothetical protein